MLMILRGSWLAIDTSDYEHPQYKSVPAGVYEVERVESPYANHPRGDGPGSMWLVFKDEPTLGAAEDDWCRYTDPNLPYENWITIIEGVGFEEWIDAAVDVAKTVLDEPRVNPETDLSPHAYAAYLVLKEGGTDEEAREAACSVEGWS
jgi:hypothetical protein